MTIKIGKGEGKWISFVYTRNGEILDMSGATMRLVVKNDPDDTAYLVEILDADFDKTNAQDLGIVRANLTETHTDALGVGIFQMQVKGVLVADEDVDKSNIMNLEVEKTLFHD